MSKLAIVLSGGSASGKNHLVEYLSSSPLIHDMKCELVTSATTRPPREGEIPDVDYSFMSKERFLELADEGYFLEFEDVFGEYYGTPSEHGRIFEDEKVPVFIVDPLGNVSLSNILRNLGINALSVCLTVEPDLALGRLIDRVYQEETLDSKKTSQLAKRIIQSQVSESQWAHIVNYDMVISTGTTQKELESCISKLNLNIEPNKGRKLLTPVEGLKKAEKIALKHQDYIENVISNRNNISAEKMKKLITKIIIRVHDGKFNSLGEEALQFN